MSLILRVESENIVKVQYGIDAEIVRLIRLRSADLGKTQGRYLSDLVELDIDGANMDEIMSRNGR